MDNAVEVLRHLIHGKLVDNRLPVDSFPKTWAGLGNGEMCAACDDVISGRQFVMEGPGRGARTLVFHVQCFHLWDEERQGL